MVICFSIDGHVVDRCKASVKVNCGGRCRESNNDGDNKQLSRS